MKSNLVHPRVTLSNGLDFCSRYWSEGEERAIADRHGWRELPGPRFRLSLDKLDRALRESRVAMGLEEAVVLLGRGYRLPSGCEVRRATPADLPAILSLWEALQPRRQLSPACGAEAWRQQVERTPGLTWNDFVLVYRGGQLRALGAAWNPDPVRQLRLGKLPLSLRGLRIARRVLQPLLRQPLLPGDGESVRLLHLTRWAAVDAEGLRALVASLANEHRRSGHLYLDLALDLEDPLAAALSGFRQVRQELGLYSASWNGRTLALSGARPVSLDLALT